MAKKPASTRKPPLTHLKGCGMRFYTPRYKVRWQYKKVGQDLEVMQEVDSLVCGHYTRGCKFGRGGPFRSSVLLCESCLRRTGIAW
jgi:hypothetical protein